MKGQPYSQLLNVTLELMSLFHGRYKTVNYTTHKHELKGTEIKLHRPTIPWYYSYQIVASTYLQWRIMNVWAVSMGRVVLKGNTHRVTT
jgi:hypothetical protein